MKWGDGGVGLGNKVPIAVLPVPFWRLVHFGRGSVSEGLSGNHQNIGGELHSYLKVQENLI